MAQAQPRPATTKPEIDLEIPRPVRRTKRRVLLGLTAMMLIGLCVTIFLLLQDDNAAPGQPGEAPRAEAKPATYLPFKPFVVNFAERGPARFLQVEIQARVSGQETVAAVELHMPAIRNDLNMLLASQRFEVVSTREGKEALREEIRRTIQQILDQQAAGLPAGSVEAVYFTSFVMQ